MSLSVACSLSSSMYVSFCQLLNSFFPRLFFVLDWLNNKSRRQRSHLYCLGRCASKYAFVSFAFLHYLGTVHLFCWFQVREEMLAERSKRLEEHHEKLGAIIAKLQIEKAKQVRIRCDGYMKLTLICLSLLVFKKTAKQLSNLTRESLHVTYLTSFKGGGHVSPFPPSTRQHI